LRFISYSFYFKGNILLRHRIFIFIACVFCAKGSFSQTASSCTFKAAAFFTAQNDLAHISFVQEANKWLSTAALKHGFCYDTTSNWDNLNSDFLKQYQLVIFLDSRPEKIDQRNAFEQYMKSGGAWLGFHFSAFALTPSAFNMDWPWYHNEFIGAGQYVSNTWRPTSAVLKVENLKHPFTSQLPTTFTSTPNEWYRWEYDLRKRSDIDILVAIDSASFPLGTGPKPNEIWHSGYYPVVWSNRNYKMVYMNMGHNDIDYENHTNKTLSNTFSSPQQNQLILNALMWLGDSKK
jgi:hypothetical protein